MNDNFTIFIGNELKSLRARKGLSLDELSKEINISKQVLSQYENNKVNISVSRLEEIIKYYGLDLYIFFKNISEYVHKTNWIKNLAEKEVI